jgi:uncharacterized membrane protein
MGRTLPPLALPLSAMAWMAVRWDRIPPRFATHFGSGNVPNGWTTRTPLHVFGLPIFAEGLTALLVGLMFVTWVGSGRRAGRKPVERIPIAVEYLVSVVFTMVGLLPVMQLPVWPLAIAIPLSAIAVIVYVAKVRSEADDAAEEAIPQDAMFVPSPFGNGYTLNFSNRWSFVFLLGLFGGIGLLTGFLLWSLR